MQQHTQPDFFDSESLLSEEEIQVRDTVGRFVDDRVMPVIADCFEKERFPRELIPEMAELVSTERFRLQ